MSEKIEESLKAIDELMDGISPRPWDWTSHKREDGKPIQSVEDVVGILALSARKGVGLELHGVGAKQNGEDIVICYTGNGPRSAANARFLANAPAAIDWLCIALREKEAEVEALREELLESKKLERQIAHEYELLKAADEKIAALSALVSKLREALKDAQKRFKGLDSYSLAREGHSIVSAALPLAPSSEQEKECEIYPCLSGVHVYGGCECCVHGGFAGRRACPECAPSSAGEAKPHICARPDCCPKGTKE